MHEAKELLCIAALKIQQSFPPLPLEMGGGGGGGGAEYSLATGPLP